MSFLLHHKIYIIGFKTYIQFFKSLIRTISLNVPDCSILNVVLPYVLSDFGRIPLVDPSYMFLELYES